MSIDVLQEKIRKVKSPIMLELAAAPADLPAEVLAAEPTEAAAFARVCRELLETLKGQVPAVRVSFSSFALLGSEGMEALTMVLKQAKRLGYYVVLDAPEILGVRSAQNVAARLFRPDTQFPCDGVVLNSYLGSDCIAPFLPGLPGGEKDGFCRHPHSQPVSPGIAGSAGRGTSGAHCRGGYSHPAGKRPAGQKRLQSGVRHERGQRPGQSEGTAGQIPRPVPAGGRI